VVEIVDAPYIPQVGDRVEFKGMLYIVETVRHRVFESRTIKGAGYESVDVKCIMDTRVMPNALI